MDKAIVEKLIDHAPLAVVVAGVIVFIIGAAGGLPIGTRALQIRDYGWRIGLGIMGAILVGTGLLLLTYGHRRPTSEEVYTAQVRQYGIKFINPRDQKQEGGQYLEVIGHYTTKPPNDALWLFIVTPQDGRYWPKANIQNFDSVKTWRGKVWIADGNYSANLVAAIVGKASQTWLRYYNNVVARQVSEAFLESPFPSDVSECDRVKLEVYTVSSR